MVENCRKLPKIWQTILDHAVMDLSSVSFLLWNKSNDVKVSVHVTNCWKLSRVIKKLLKVYQLFGTIFHFCGHWHVWSQNFLLWNYAMTSNSVCFCNFSESCFVVLKNKHQKVIFIRKVEKIQYLSYDVQKNNDLFGVLAKAEKPFLLQMHIGRKID